MTLAALLFDHPYADGDPLLHGPQETVAAGEARARARSVAETLRVAGVEPGRAVAVQLPNGPGAIIAMFGERSWLTPMHSTSKPLVRRRCSRATNPGRSPIPRRTTTVSRS